MKKELLKTIIRDFHLSPLPTLRRRLIEVPYGRGKVLSLVGPRRSGKTSLALSLLDELTRQGTRREETVYLNFEDERLDLGQGDLDLILQAYQELYPGLEPARCHIVLDEIQGVPGWDRFVRRLHDSVTKNIIVTGSSARLLSREIATSLRGRTLPVEVFPLSSREHLAFRGVEADVHASRSRARVVSELEGYLRQGGYPELVDADERFRQRVLQEYFTVMTFRDIAERHGIGNLAALRFFLKRLLASAGSSFSVNAIYNDLKAAGHRIGKNQLYDWLEASQDCYLCFTLRRLKAAATERELGEKKVYLIDNGLLNAVTFRFSADTGRLMEQVVFLHLRRRTGEVYFYRERGECDFVVREGERAVGAVQVCRSLADPKTRARELRGLVECCKACGLGEGTIITAEETDQFTEAGVRIRVVPLWRWLLEG